VQYAKRIIDLCSRETGDERPAPDLEAAAIQRLERHQMMLEATGKRYRYLITKRVLDLDHTGVPGAMTAQLAA
jgi:hypothetical protein